MPQFIDLTGQKFGRLTVLKRMDSNQRGYCRWLCKCICGKEKIICSNDLKSGNTKSCGCLFLEGNRTQHGHLKNDIVSKTYNSWLSMIQRCTNPNKKAYKYYGGRGIKVCKRWKNSFENFLEDMGEPPTQEHSIDRIDNNKGYNKSNCRWATKKQQMRNTRRNHFETHDGKTLCLSEWAEELNINYSTLSSRIFILGWPIEKALTTPVKSHMGMSPL